MNDLLLTAKQLQDLLQVDRTTIYRMLSDGRLTGIKVGGQWRFSRKEVDDMLAGVVSTKPVETRTPIEILPIDCLQSIQNVFAEIAGVGAITTAPDGEPLTEVSHPCHFCNIVQSTESGRQACIASWRQLAAQSSRRPAFSTCHAGLQYARARIEIEDTLIAVLVAGQFYVVTPDTHEELDRLHQLADKHQLDLDALIEAAAELPRLDSHKREHMSGWLETVAHSFEDISNERAALLERLRRIATLSTLESEN
jgi:excisionase family DNA binding protein